MAFARHQVALRKGKRWFAWRGSPFSTLLKTCIAQLARRGSNQPSVVSRVAIGCSRATRRVWIHMQSDEWLAHNGQIVQVFWWWTGPKYHGLEHTYYHSQAEVAARLGPGQAGVLCSFRVLHVLWGFEIFLGRYSLYFKLWSQVSWTAHLELAGSWFHLLSDVPIPNSLITTIQHQKSDIE